VNSKEFQDERAWTSVLFINDKGRRLPAAAWSRLLWSAIFMKRSDRDEPRHCVAHSRQKSLNRFGARALSFPRPDHSWTVRVLHWIRSGEGPERSSSRTRPRPVKRRRSCNSLPTPLSSVPPQRSSFRPGCGTNRAIIFARSTLGQNAPTRLTERGSPKVATPHSICRRSQRSTSDAAVDLTSAALYSTI
jgi:hypothetical protein